MRRFNVELYVVIIIILCFSWCSSIRRFAQNNNLLEGKYELTDSLQTIKTRSAIECHCKCSSYDDCLSFFYNSMIQQCILHRDSFIYSTPSEQGGGWKFYSIKQGSSRCPSSNGFIYNGILDLCFNLNTPMTINYPFFKQFCGNMNAELVRIDTTDKQQFIELITDNKTTERICIQGTDNLTAPIWTFDDGTDNLTEPIWTFDDGTLMTFFNWDLARSQPDGRQGNIEMYTGYKWHDLEDVSSSPCIPICERR
ncbi:Hypothetical predicted protein [Mytilus galloprovincialis]|uniref:C-type lectin domain-containing protein n=1 Tax=Mytilus galloprovincialis TaxID=29158 RepID=A0A8B6D1Z8_MYTGA|nr:Hypothetical predicted protein [Mytilus galloprovincialis]